MTARPLLALPPATTVVFTALAAVPGRSGTSTPTAPIRLAVTRAAVAAGSLGVLSVELLGAREAISPSSVTATWVLAVVVAIAAARWRGWRWRGVATWGLASPRAATERLRSLWAHSGWPARLMAAALLGVVMAELLLATAEAPNTFDSQTYHLPRIERWVVEHSVGPYPTRVHRQVTYPPGAEYLLLHLRLLTGGDALYPLLQWLAGLLCLLCVTRIVVQLGGGRRAQLLAAFVIGTAPALVLEASSTQVDLVVAAWVASLATLVLDGVGPAPGSPPSGLNVILLGMVTGLIGVTKSPALVVAGALLAWWGLAWLRRSPRLATGLRVAGAAAAIVAVTAITTGPYLWRTYREFGHPLGPDYLRQSISLQRHDPAAILVNGLRQTHSMVDTPLRPLSELTAAGVTRLSRAIGVDPNDPKITFNASTFPAATWYPSEGKAAIPFSALLLTAGVLAALFRPRRRALAGIVLLAVVAHASTVKWSLWGNRLTLYIMVLAAPLAGLWLDQVLRQPQGSVSRREPLRRRVLAAGLVSCLALSGAAGVLSVGYGWPRRLVGERSVFTIDRWHSRFVIRPEWADDFTAVATAVRGSGARRVGIVQGNDSWEYPWWLLLKDQELVALQSQLPKHPATPPSEVDAMVCSSPVATCRKFVPRGWKLHQHGTLSYALRPPEPWATRVSNATEEG